MNSSINGNQDTFRFDLTAFVVACFLGNAIWRLKFNLKPLGYIALGSTGGILLTSLILGHIGKRRSILLADWE